MQPSLFPNEEEPDPSAGGNSEECRLVHENRFALFQEWVRTIRDPAQRASEGVRRLETRRGRACAEYEIAPLPDGRFAVRVDCAFKTGDYRGVATPWTDFDEREDCIAFFLETARRHFQHESGLPAVRAEMRLLLRETLCGFVEPEPRRIQPS